MNPAKRALNRTKKLVVDHQVLLAVTVTAAVCTTATAMIIKKDMTDSHTDFLDQVDSFLHEKGVHAELMTRLHEKYM